MAGFELSAGVNADNVFLVSFQNLIQRWDATAYRTAFKFTSNKYASFKLSEIAHINPSVNFNKLDDNDEISFVPMEVVDEINGHIKEQRTKKIAETKGFTRFEENDLLWAKITPCMQNGKSAVVRKLKNGKGCGSTEFFIIRPKNESCLVDYLHFLLRDARILDVAQNFFGGSAGQQRVAVDFIKNLKIPLPTIEVQNKIVDKQNFAILEKKQKEQQAQALLDSIDGYLLNELGITLPEQDNRLEKRMFTVPFSEVTGQRVDPDYYKLSYQEIISQVEKSKFSLITLGEVANLLASGKTPASFEYSEIPTDYPIIKVGSYTQNFINLEKTDFTIEPQRLVAHKGDIFILSAAHQPEYVGRHIKYLDNEPEVDTSYVGELICVRTNEHCNSMFLFSLLILDMFKVLINREKTGQTSHVYGKDIKSIKIPLPPLSKQTEIATHITQIRAQAKQLQAEAAKLLAAAKAEIERMILGEVKQT